MAIPRARDLDRFQGAIAAGAFTSGEQVVVGMWGRSPLGSFVDVMWVRPDGERVLLAPSRTVRDFVGDVYAFDREEVVAAAPPRHRLPTSPPNH